jgi:hypothetical protein
MGRREHEHWISQRKAAIKRRRDAEALWELGEKHTRAAMYLGGYAIECKLKATAMEAFACQTLSELAKRWGVDENIVYTHGLEALFKRLKLYQNFRESPVYNGFVRHVNRWRPSWRYDHRDANPEDARDFLDAVSDVYQWLDANRY